jgi:drug/metabolite transporter (DMT)-like permease
MKPMDYFRLVLLAAIWGASFLFMRVAAPVLGAIPSAFFRVLFGALGLAAILAILRVRWIFNGKFSSTLGLGIINSGIPFLMYSLAAQLLPAGYLAIFNATTPLMGALIGYLFFQEQISARKAVGVAAGIGGVALLTATGPILINASVVMGALACMVSTGCYGAAGFLTRRWISERGGLDSKVVAFGSQIGAGLFLIPFFATSATIAPPSNWGGSTVWLALAALGLVCTAWAYILYFRLIADIGPVRSLTVTFLIPPFGVLWGALFLGEQVSWAHLAGGSLIGIAVWLVLSQAKPPASTAARTATERSM